MITICKGRGNGKTVDIIKHAAKNDCIILVANQRRVGIIASTAKKLGVQVKAMTVQQLISGQMAGMRKDLAIDDADDVLSYMIRSAGYFGGDIRAMSFPNKRKE